MRKYLAWLCCYCMACSGGYPSGVMSPKEMKGIIYDLMSVDDYLSNTLIKDSTINLKKQRSLLYEKTFTIHKTDRKTFYASLKYYQQHPDLQKTMLDSVAALANQTPVQKVPAKPVNFLKKFKRIH